MHGNIHLSWYLAAAHRTLLGATLCLATFGLGCGQPDRAAPAPEVEDTAPLGDISGRYDVKGVTSTPGTPHARQIAGTIVIRQVGDAYTASYELETLFPGENKPVEAHVVGVGDGQLDGRKMTGTARTQVVVSTVPGVDPGFAFIPRGVTTRILSESVGLVSADGTLSVDIVSRAAEGETYTATRTRLSGQRIDDLTPDVAAAP